jgi:hypothetical protein
MTTRDWLRQNGYEDVRELIDEVIAELAAKGSKERRNWWDVLAGGKDGAPIVVAGREFPVLRAAQIRQGKPVTPNAIYRNENEQPLDVVRTGRWPKKLRRKNQLPVKAKRQAKTTGRRRPSNHARAH